MGAFVNGCYREDMDTVPGEHRLTPDSLARLKAESAAAHSRIDAAIRFPGGSTIHLEGRSADERIYSNTPPPPSYSCSLDSETDPAPLDLSPGLMSLEAIRERHAMGEGDRRQLLADRAWLLAEVDRADGRRS